MYGFSLEAVMLLGVTWSVGFASSLARAISDADGRGFGRILAFACTSGFVVVGVVGLTCSDPRDDGFNWLLYVGVSALVGYTGKDQDKIARFALKGFLRGIRQTIDETDKQ